VASEPGRDRLPAEHKAGVVESQRVLESPEQPSPGSCTAAGRRGGCAMASRPGGLGTWGPGTEDESAFGILPHSWGKPPPPTPRSPGRRGHCSIIISESYTIPCALDTGGAGTGGRWGPLCRSLACRPAGAGSAGCRAQGRSRAITKTSRTPCAVISRLRGCSRARRLCPWPRGPRTWGPGELGGRMSLPPGFSRIHGARRRPGSYVAGNAGPLKTHYFIEFHDPLCTGRRGRGAGGAGAPSAGRLVGQRAGTGWPACRARGRSRGITKTSGTPCGAISRRRGCCRSPRPHPRPRGPGTWDNG
jgi:hypothetical protein